MTKIPNSQAHAALIARIDAALVQDRLIALLPDGPLKAPELRERISGVGQALLDHATPGATIAISCRTDRFVIAAVTACLRLGYPVLICDPQGTTEETSALLKHCEASVLVTDIFPNPFADQVPELFVLDATNIKAGDEARQFPLTTPPPTALLVATSGTTDKPKVVALSHANLLAQYQIFSDVYGFDANTRALNILPLHHVDGIIRGPLLALWYGAVLIRTRSFSPQASLDVIADIETHNATHLITVPAMLRILHRAYDTRTFHMPPSMRFILCSADHLDANLWRMAEQDFGVPVVNAYGLSEVVCDALIAGPDKESRVIGSIGVARGLVAKVIGADGQDCADGETGELVIIGDTVMQGYVSNQAGTAEVLQDGNFRTGDLVQRRADGVFLYMGRKKNVVVVGGVTINPEAVTEVLSSLPGVAEACAFGHNTETDEALLAAVCPLPGSQLDLDAINEECRKRLSPERQPSRLVILEQLPRRETGKVDQLAIAAAAFPNVSKKSVEEIAATCFNVPIENLSDSSSPFDTPGWDSLAHMNFIELLEETFDFTMSPGDVASLMSISDAIEIVRREMG